MAISFDLSTRHLPFSVACALATKDIAYSIALPRGVTRFLLEFEGTTGKYAFTGTEGSALSGRHSVATDTTVAVEVGGVAPVVYVQSDANTKTVHITALPG